MSDNKSVLRFEKYIVDKVYYKTNENCMKEAEEIDLPFDFETKTEYENNQMVIELGATIFQNAEENNYPFEMEVVLKGYFRVKGIQNDIKLFEKNAIAIMFPYLRAIVSTYTANANVAPVLLPAMNINEYFRKKYETNGQ